MNPYVIEPVNPLETCYQDRYEKEDNCRKYGYINLDCEKDLQDKFYSCVNKIYEK